MLSLKGNEIKGGIVEIAKSFVHNKKALCIKELDVSKCQIDCSHITQDFIQMLKADYCTLKVLTMRDNFIKAPTAERIKDALKSNRTMVKLSLDFNPIKQRCVEQIDEICRRNLALDEINTKNKNLELLALKKQTANTQKESLTSEICNLKQFTDKAV